MIDKVRAVELLNRQIERGEAAQKGADARSWQLDSIAVLERVFGKDSRQVEMFRSIRSTPQVLFAGADNSEAWNAASRTALIRSVTLLESALNEVKEFWEDDQSDTADPFKRLECICERFHAVARQLRHRYNGRPSLDVNDEYDVQDLIHALLLLDFEDIRAEEWTPSYAGACSRMDFLLKREKIVIEVKRTRKGLAGKEIGDQLLVDCQRYKGHPDCKMLVCFVYDPEGLIANPRGLETDLSTAGDELPLKVFVRP
jgi:hypothetical protein